MKDKAFPRAACAIAGAATFGIGLCEGHSALEMTARAGLLALKDAGLGLADVDGLFTCLPEDLLGGLAVACSAHDRRTGSALRRVCRG